MQPTQGNAGVETVHTKGDLPFDLAQACMQGLDSDREQENLLQDDGR